MTRFRVRSCSLFARLHYTLCLLVARSHTTTMATFSPAPRRTTRYASIGMSPSPPRQGLGRRTRSGSTQPQSRFSTPARRGNLAPVRDDDSIMSSSGMDVDDDFSEIFERGVKAETVFSRSKEMTVSFYAQLPVEVRQALRDAGMVHMNTFYALISSYMYVFRLLPGRVHGRRRSCYGFRCGCVTGDMFRVEV